MGKQPELTLSMVLREVSVTLTVTEWLGVYASLHAWLTTPKDVPMLDIPVLTCLAAVERALISATIPPPPSGWMSTDKELGPLVARAEAYLATMKSRRPE